MIIPEIKIDLINSLFNSYHNRLQFTVEQEENNSIGFSNLELLRFTGHKIGTVKNIVDSDILLAEVPCRSENSNLFKKLLFYYNHPHHFIDKHINKRLFEIQKKANNTNYHKFIQTCKITIFEK